MSIDPRDNALIEQYILGKLNESEKQAFEARLKTDREFARKTRMIQTFPEMMSEPSKKEYDRQKEKEAEPKQKEKKFTLPSNKVIYGVAGGMVLVILVFFIIFRQNHDDLNITAFAPKNHEEKVEVSKNTSPVTNTDLTKTAVSSVMPKDSIKPNVKTIEIKPEPKTNTASIGGAFQLLAPADGFSFSKSDEILFKWVQPVDSFTRLCICSVANNFVVLWRGIRPGIREYKIPGKNFYPGSFYWYVGTAAQKRHFSVNP